MATAPSRRLEVLDHLTAESLDVLVVGGGATGAGIALDAVTRGYRVGLVEREDLASGTSSKSSKLIHGGVRYLANGDVAMVVEGVRERNRLRDLAPHLVRPLGFVIPVDTVADALMLRAGLSLYDAIGIGQGARTHRRLSVREVLMDAPGLATIGSRGGLRYDDAQTDDARLVLAVAQAAHEHGAVIATHAAVTAVEGRRDGRWHVTVRDELGGQDLDVAARWVVHAGGAWADTLGDVGPDRIGTRIQPAKGVHLTFRREDVPVNRAIVIPSVRDDGRRVFLVPWGDQVYLGTTDDVDMTSGAPTVEASDAAYLLDALNAAFATNLGVDDAIGAWAGWRPLVAGDGQTKDLSRRHVVLEPEPGLVIVTGGKLTTYRRMARDTMDHVAAGDGVRRPSRTGTIALGARGSALDGLGRARRAMQAAGGDLALAGSLYHRHGDRAPVVVSEAAADGELDRLVPGLPYLVGEVRWAVRHEWALTLSDVLERRLRVSLRNAAAGGPAIELAASIMAEELGWSDDERARQVRAYVDGVVRERGVVPLAR